MITAQKYTISAKHTLKRRVFAAGGLACRLGNNSNIQRHLKHRSVQTGNAGLSIASVLTLIWLSRTEIPARLENRRSLYGSGLSQTLTYSSFVKQCDSALCLIGPPLPQQAICIVVGNGQTKMTAIGQVVHFTHTENCRSGDGQSGVSGRYENPIWYTRSLTAPEYCIDIRRNPLLVNVASIGISISCELT